MTNELVSVHPLLIAGWCGLTTTALNLLPVGALDGGRCMQAAYGRAALRVSSLMTYTLLALGLVSRHLKDKNMSKYTSKTILKTYKQDTE
jgi:membrane-associated protease RseP (regulator of RpoE activity)